MLVPAIIQFWDADPPAEVQPLLDGWRAAAAQVGFDYLLFDDDSARAFIARHHGAELETAFLACAVPAMRADLFRYCALAVRPGVYVDADIECKRFRRRFYRALDRGLLCQRRNKEVVNDVLMVRRARDPLLQALVEQAARNIAARTSNNVWSVTGPGVATALLKTHGPDHPLFAGFTIASAKVLDEMLKFRWDLEYRQTDKHWRHAQRARSIFADAPAPPDAEPEGQAPRPNRV